MDGWLWSLTKPHFCSLVHHGDFDDASIGEGEGQVLSVGEQEVFLPHSSEDHSVDQRHLLPLAPPQSFCLSLP